MLLLLLPLVASYRAGVPQCSAAAASPSAAYAALEPVPVLRVIDGASVRLTEQWAADERAVLVFFRSFG